ncbi:family 43 glycosylhydrolase [Mucilaginibacter sp. UR6-1]|uniref:family 43 glycosylhydrolase n=1 Tax=Mucilaginibacter sp. UR6-1 TaxID=1435643 RepID=UPI001E637D62|nr:family 43 glycosylhydrolase [Mucilaginibacter sp. UR6-1]MCC8408141.1 family 43 glycosylhydrolase [Mucilaginibacter sp. UR6-1]
MNYSLLKKALMLLFAPLFITATCMAQTPAAIPGDYADPSVIRVGNTYYSVATSSEWAPHYPIYQSKNLKDWVQTGYVFDQTPEWISGSFWAPEYYKIKDTYYIYYTARRKSDGISCIGVATSKYPDHGFKDQGVVVAFGKEAIDAFLFRDKGQLYITFKAYGLDDRPIEILGSRLSADGLRLEGETFSMLKDTPRIGLEGQSILKIGKYYYLFYSAGNCCGIDCSYNVRVVRSINFKGPYELYNNNPVLFQNDKWKCMGHGTFVTNAAGKYFYVHHAYNKDNTVFTGREGLISEVSFKNRSDWPVFKPATDIPAVKTNITDTFTGMSLAKYWQWDFRHSVPRYLQFKGILQLSGATTQDNNTGVVLALRPYSSTFEASVNIVNKNNELKGLAYYGDANAALGIGIKGDSIICWRVREGKWEQARAIQVAAAKGIGLKIKVDVQHNCTFYYKANTKGWLALPLTKPVSASYLPQWDRSPRIGLHYKGSSSINAEFDDFNIEFSK